MRMTFLKTILAVGALALSVQSVAAATFNFANGSAIGSPSTSTSQSFTSGGVTVTVKAGQFLTFNSSNPTRSVTLNGSDLVTQTVNGLGEKRTTGAAATLPDNNSSVNSGNVGANLFREALAFSFDKTVKIVSVTFFASSASAAQGFVFSGPTLTATAATNSFATATGSGAGLRTLNFGSYIGNNFAFGASALAGANFWISSMEVQVVPLPAGGLLLGSLVVVPFLRRKRRAA